MKQTVRATLLGSIIMFSTLALPAQNAMTMADYKEKLNTIVQENHEKNGGMMGVYFQDLKTKEEVAINADDVFPTASTIKLPVACTLLSQMSDKNTSFTDYFATTVYDGTTKYGGTGFLQNYKVGTPMEIKELLHLMITVSDNTATNMLVAWLGGPEVINDWLKQKGFDKTRMYSTVGGAMVSDREGRRVWGLGSTTPREIGRILDELHSEKLLCTTATEELLRVLGHQYFDNIIASEVPPTVWVGSKSGSVSDSRSDCAIVSGYNGPYILVLYTKDNKDTSWGDNNTAELLMKSASALTWKFTNPEKPFIHPTQGRL